MKRRLYNGTITISMKNVRTRLRRNRRKKLDEREEREREGTSLAKGGKIVALAI